MSEKRVVVSRLAAGAASVLFAAVLLSGCSASASHPVATFEVGGQETYKIELTSDKLVEHVEALLAGADVAAIPVGDVVRDSADVNEPWSWHIDPATLEFAEVAIGGCDGLPSGVEDGTVSSDQYCPWSAQIVSIDR